jgi:hypothetical protein
MSTRKQTLGQYVVVSSILAFIPIVLAAISLTMNCNTTARAVVTSYELSAEQYPRCKMNVYFDWHQRNISSWLIDNCPSNVFKPPYEMDICFRKNQPDRIRSRSNSGGYMRSELQAGIFGLMWAWFMIVVIIYIMYLGADYDFTHVKSWFSRNNTRYFRWKAGGTEMTEQKPAETA